MEEVYIIDAVRTPFGRFGGSLKGFAMTDLGSLVIGGLIERNAEAKGHIDEVIMGNVAPTGECGGNPARIAALKAGLPDSVPGWTININCGSGLQAINMAAALIRSGEAEAIVAGGMESMSNAAFISDSTRWGARLRHGQLSDAILLGLHDPVADMRMDETAEKLAGLYNISRDEQDELACRSQNLAEKAITGGRIKDEILPVELKDGKDTVFDTDEHPRFGTTPESLARLKPAFSKDGTITAGNSSGINDGAAAVLLMSRSKAEELGFKPLAKIVSWAVAGVDPSIMGIGPVDASRKALTRIDKTVGDLDVVECNEAFAAQFIAVERELKWDRERVNPNGGAIALGHPVSASGPRILATLAYEMRRRDARLGLATLCVGGGHGVATVIERTEEIRS